MRQVIFVMVKQRILQRGFTLVELMISMSITLILLTALASLLSNTLLAYQINSRRTEVQQTARIAADTIVREFKFATGVTSVSDTSISFTAPYAGTAQNITISLGADDGILYIKRGSEVRQPITGRNNVIILHRSPVFSRPGDSRVLYIQITAQYAGDDSSTETITTSVAGMNLSKI
jgi:prepilin-type N-terminal cleavage/methylation domain-containing protein